MSTWLLVCIYQLTSINFSAYETNDNGIMVTSIIQESSSNSKLVSHAYYNETTIICVVRLISMLRIKTCIRKINIQRYELIKSKTYILSM